MTTVGRAVSIVAPNIFTLRSVKHYIWCNLRLTTRSSVKSDELAIPHAAIQTIILSRCSPAPEILIIIPQRGM